MSTKRDDQSKIWRIKASKRLRKPICKQWRGVLITWGKLESRELATLKKDKKTIANPSLPQGRLAKVRSSRLFLCALSGCRILLDLRLYNSRVPCNTRRILWRQIKAWGVVRACCLGAWPASAMLKLTVELSRTGRTHGHWPTALARGLPQEAQVTYDVQLSYPSFSFFFQLELFRFKTLQLLVFLLFLRSSCFWLTGLPIQSLPFPPLPTSSVPRMFFKTIKLCASLHFPTWLPPSDRRRLREW